jgi:hypothetical protein
MKKKKSMRGRNFTKIGEFAKTCVFSTDDPWLDLSICGGYETTEEEIDEGFNHFRHLGFALQEPKYACDAV